MQKKKKKKKNIQSLEYWWGFINLLNTLGSDFLLFFY